MCRALVALLALGGWVRRAGTAPCAENPATRETAHVVMFLTIPQR